MGFTEVNSLDADVTIALGKVDKETRKAYPKQAEGYYLGKRVVENKRGESQLHFLQSAIAYKDFGLGVGQNLGIWGTTDLNRKLSSIAPGAMVRITSTGTKPTPNGDMYTYKVEADNDNRIDVGTAEDTGYTGRTASDSAVDDDESEDDEDFSQAQALAALERKSEVERLLKSGKSKKN